MSVLICRTLHESRFCLREGKKYSWPSYCQFLFVFCLYCVEVVSVFVLVQYERGLSSAGGFDDLDGLLCVQRRLQFKFGRNETMVFQLWNYFQRLTLESWYTNLEQPPLNRCQQLPVPYKQLIHDENKTDKRTSNRPTQFWLTINGPQSD